MSDGLDSSIPFACQDWAATKAAYRFLANARVDESDILAGHFAATAQRFKANTEPVLLLQDTTEFIYERTEPERIGFTKAVFTGCSKRGMPRKHTLCGILMHTSLACTAEGLPLGLTALKAWSGVVRPRLSAKLDCSLGSGQIQTTVERTHRSH